MEARDNWDVWYIISVLAVNGLAFVIILVCYAQIYLSLGKETRQAARTVSRGEMTVAKKMALLVNPKFIQFNFIIERLKDENFNCFLHFRYSQISLVGHQSHSLDSQRLLVIH